MHVCCYSCVVYLSDEKRHKFRTKRLQSGHVNVVKQTKCFVRKKKVLRLDLINYFSNSFC